MKNNSSKKINSINEILGPEIIMLGVAVLFINILIILLQYAMMSIMGGKINLKLTRIMQDITKDPDVNVKVITNKIPNAFNTGNKTQYITSGLFKLLSEKEIIAVLMHEYGHFTGKHVHKLAGLNFLGGISAGFFVISLIIMFPMPYIIAIYIGLFLTISKNVLVNVTKGREYEYYADSYAKKMGYGKELISALKKFEKYIRNKVCKNKSTEKCDRIMRTMHSVDEHPETKDRIKNLLKTKLLKKLLSNHRTLPIALSFLQKLKSKITK